MPEWIYLMKAKKFNEEENIDLEGWLIQPKLDGIRCQIIINGKKDIRAYSRSKRKDDSLNEFTDKIPHIIQEVSRLGLRNTILDGELVSYAYDTAYDNCKFASGTLHSKDAVTRQLLVEPLHFAIFDLPLSPLNNYDRNSQIMSLFDNHDSYQFISPVISIINHGDYFWTSYKQIIESGGEGIILRNPNGLYKHSDSHTQVSKDLLKIKEIKECEILIDDWDYGLSGTQFEDTVGVLKGIDGLGNKVTIGSGLNAEIRAEIKTGELSLPFIVDMAYNDFNEKEGTYRLPRILKVRYWKTVDDWTR